MNISDIPVPPGWSQWVLLLAGIARIVAEGYRSLANGSGLIGMWKNLLYGTNIPKPIAQDYKKELSKPPFPNDQPNPQ